MKTARIPVPDGLAFPKEALWEELVRSWEGTTQEVDRAKAAKQEVGTRLAKALLENGAYATYGKTDYPMGNIGPEFRGDPPEEKRPWMIFSAPDEWKTYVDDGTGTIKVVRIGPGENAELDDTTRAIHTALELRRRECEYYFDLFRNHQRSMTRDSNR
jgi:hypothetical protein